MYDLESKELEYGVVYQRGSREIPFVVKITPPSAEELIRYEREATPESELQKGGGSITETAEGTGEVELFDAHFAALVKPSPNGEAREKQLTLIPAVVKRAVIRAGLAGVDPAIQRDTDATLASLTADAAIEITHTVNGSTHLLKHFMASPSGEDDIEYRRATSGRVKVSRGRKRQAFSVLQRYSAYPELYDKLVRRVEGYSLGEEQKLDESNKELWLSRVPYFHKKVAVALLFGSAVPEDDDDLG